MHDLELLIPVVLGEFRTTGDQAIKVSVFRTDILDVDGPRVLGVAVKGYLPCLVPTNYIS